jgi:hypothetical protein
MVPPSALFLLHGHENWSSRFVFLLPFSVVGWVGNWSNPQVGSDWVKKHSRIDLVGLADIVFGLD